jgi:tripartite-type tricarboxylate transporter receptor subunit TctC
MRNSRNEVESMRRRSLVVALLLACLALPAWAQAPDAFRPKQVTIIVSFEAGGGYDIYGRLVARSLPAHLPGRPTVIVQNMPGAGGLVGTNYLYAVAPRDGSVIGMVPQTVIIGQVLDSAGGKYDARRFAWLGRMNSNAEIEHSWTASGVTGIAEAKRREVVVAGTGPASSSVVFPRLMNALIGTKFKIVPGYEGANSATLALERGEVEAIVRPWAVIKSTSQEWLAQRKITLLVQYAVTRHPDLPQVPAIADLAESAEQRQIFTLYASGSDIGRSLMAPPGLPPATLAVLRRAILDTMADPALLQEAAQAKIDLDPLAGEALQHIAEASFAVAPELIDRAKRATEPR